MNSKVGNFSRRRPQFASGEADAGPPKNASFFGWAVAAQNKLSDASRCKMSGCRRRKNQLLSSFVYSCLEGCLTRAAENMIKRIRLICMMKKRRIIYRIRHSPGVFWVVVLRWWKSWVLVFRRESTKTLYWLLWNRRIWTRKRNRWGTGSVLRHHFFYHAYQAYPLDHVFFWCLRPNFEFF